MGAILPNQTTVRSNGGTENTRRRLNFLNGTNVTITQADDSTDNETDITITSTASGTGDLVGPASSTDNALVRFDGTTGKLVQSSSGSLSDAGALNAVSLTLTNDLPVTEGGTGASTLTGVVIGNGTSAFTTVTAPSGTIVGTTDSQTLTNKTLTSPIIATISNTGTLTLPTSTDTLVGKATTDTLTNKTLTSPTISGGTITGITDLAVADGGTGASTLTGILKGNGTSAFTAVTAPTGTIVGTTDTQTLTNKTLTTPIISSISNTGTLTLPTSTDTLVGKATTDTLTNKTLTAPVIATISNTGTLTLPTSTDTLVGRATTDTLTNKTLTSPTISGGTITGITDLAVADGGTGSSTVAAARTALAVEAGGASDFTVGATGADYTDIQSALDAVGASGGTIFVMDGTYTITTGLLVKTSRTRLRISQGAVIQCNGATVTTLIKPNTTALSQMFIEGGKWLQTNATVQGVCFDFSDCPNHYISGCRVESFGTAVKLSDTTNTTFYSSYRDIQIFDCNNGLDIGTGGTLTNDNVFDSIRIRPKAGGAGTGIKVVDSRGLTFIHCNVEPSSPTGITGISLDATSRECVFTNCWIEGNATGVSIVSGATRNTFLGSTITGNTTDISDSGTDTVFINTNKTGTTRSSLQKKTFATVGTDNTADYVTDGTADEVQIQQAIDAIGAAGGGMVFLKAGTYTIAATITIGYSNVQLVGEQQGAVVIKCASTMTGDTPALDASVSTAGSSLPLTVNTAIGNTTVTMSTANSATLAAGDYVILSSSQLSDSESASKKHGEIHEVASVNTGTGVVTFTDRIFHAYLTSDTAKVVKKTFLSNITVKNIEFTSLAATGGIFAGFVRFKWCLNARAENLYIHDAYHTGIDLLSCLGSRIDNCRVANMKDVTPNANCFYGAAFSSATQNCVISNCHFYRTRHGITGGGVSQTNLEGITRNNIVSNCTAAASYAAGFDTHESQDTTTFTNCTADGGIPGGTSTTAHGFQMRGLNSSIVGCSVLNVRDFGIYYFGTITTRGNIEGNNIDTCGNSAIYLDSLGTKEVNIIGNTAKNCVGAGVEMAGTNNDVNIMNNTFDTTNTSGGSGTIVANNSDRVQVTGNSIVNNPTGPAIQMIGTSTNWHISENYFNNNVGNPVLVNTYTCRNNSGMNPIRLYAQGNVTGATTFDRVNGETVTATLTGNITVTLTAGKSKGDRLILILTQDGTGSRTATWPSNFKKVAGSLTLTTTASAVDIIEMVYDGTNWREVGRNLALS